VNVLVAFTLWLLAVTLVLLARALTGYRTRVANVWWSLVDQSASLLTEKPRSTITWQRRAATRQNASPK
jgi:hypothetical protein